MRAMSYKPTIAGHVSRFAPEKEHKEKYFQRVMGTVRGKVKKPRTDQKSCAPPVKR